MGVLLPAPDIGRAAAAPMLAARRAGYECGIHTWDHVVWQDNVRQRGEAWTRQQMRLAFARYSDIFGEELIGNDDIDERNVARTLLTRTETDADHVFTLHAELEGGLLMPAFDELLQGWKAQGDELVSLAVLYRHVRRSSLSALPLAWGSVPGRSGALIVAQETSETAHR